MSQLEPGKDLDVFFLFDNCREGPPLIWIAFRNIPSLYINAFKMTRKCIGGAGGKRVESDSSSLFIFFNHSVYEPGIESILVYKKGGFRQLNSALFLNNNRHRVWFRFEMWWIRSETDFDFRDKCMNRLNFSTFSWFRRLVRCVSHVLHKFR